MKQKVPRISTPIRKRILCGGGGESLAGEGLAGEGRIWDGGVWEGRIWEVADVGREEGTKSDHV